MRAEGNPGRLVIAGLVLVVVAVVTVWFLRNFERRTIEIEVGWSAAARRNPFLAAELYLRRLGYQVESVAGRGPLRDLPPTTDVLVVNGLGPLNEGRRLALERWVEAGGGLLVVAHEPSEGDEAGPDDFLANLGIRLRETEGEPLGGDRVELELELADQPRPLRFSAPARRYLEDAEDRSRAATPAGDGELRLLQLPLGRGQITVSADNRFVTNAGIGEHDHAALLAFLAYPAEGGKVWLLFDSGVPSLTAILWRSAPQAMLSGGLLLLAFGWHLGRRLGPLEPPPDRGRRDLLEGLEAGADFLWRQGRAAHLSAAARGRVEGAWLRRHPPLRALGQAERAHWIAARLSAPSLGDPRPGENPPGGRTPEGEVWRALYSLPGNTQRLVEDAALLQRLWARLHLD